MNDAQELREGFITCAYIIRRWLLPAVDTLNELSTADVEDFQSTATKVITELRCLTAKAVQAGLQEPVQHACEEAEADVTELLDKIKETKSAKDEKTCWNLLPPKGWGDTAKSV